MAVVAHPNLALIYGAEMWRGTPMLVCEYLSGGTLSERLARLHLSVDEAIALGLVMADVLEHIHGVGVVHCDIKPSNIGFAADNVPKLLDFGLARIVSDAQRPTQMRQLSRWQAAADATISRLAGLASVQSTDSQRIIGTLLYMSPEAIRMEPLSTSFDLWSVCVVLDEALTCGDMSVHRTDAARHSRAHGASAGRRCQNRASRLSGVSRRFSRTRWPTIAAGARSRRRRFAGRCYPCSATCYRYNLSCFVS